MTKTARRAQKGPVAATPKPWECLFYLEWFPWEYVFAQGRIASLFGYSWELIPYVESGTGGRIAGYAISVDRGRVFWERVPGTIEHAQAVAELKMMEELQRIERERERRRT